MIFLYQNRNKREMGHEKDTTFVSTNYYKHVQMGEEANKWRVLTTGLGLGLPAAALLAPLVALHGHEEHQIQHPHGG